jgi:hypothetical protein
VGVDAGDESHAGQNGEIGEEPGPSPTGHGGAAPPHPVGEHDGPDGVGRDDAVIGGDSSDRGDEDDREQQEDHKGGA